MPFAEDHPGYQIETEEQARNWVMELVADVESARSACNVLVPDNLQVQAKMQVKAYRVFMVKHGSALGAIMALHRAGKVGDVAYNELRQRVLDSLAPTIVGEVRQVLR